MTTSETEKAIEEAANEYTSHEPYYDGIKSRAGFEAGARFGIDLGFKRAVEMLRSEEADVLNPSSMERPDEIWTPQGWADWLQEQGKK